MGIKEAYEKYQAARQSVEMLWKAELDASLNTAIVRLIVHCDPSALTAADVSEDTKAPAPPSGVTPWIRAGMKHSEWIAFEKRPLSEQELSLVADGVCPRCCHPLAFNSTNCPACDLNCSPF